MASGMAGLGRILNSSSGQEEQSTSREDGSKFARETNGKSSQVSRC